MNEYQNDTAKTGAESIVWDLSDLYPSHTHESFIHDLKETEHNAREFYNKWHGNVQNCTDDALLMLIQELEHINDTIGRLVSRVRLEWTTDSENAELTAVVQSLSERITDIRQNIIFVSVELRNITDEHYAYLTSSPLLARYKHWLEHNRKFRDHTLSEPEEKIDAEKDLVGITAWVRFSDQLHASTRFDFNGEKVTIQHLMRLMQNSDRSVRKAASESLSRGLEQTAFANTFVMNMVMTDRLLDDKIRGYSSWITPRNMANKISDGAVDSLVQSVVNRYDIAGRYFALKRTMMGLPDFYEYDRNAPAMREAQRWSWDEARQIVSKAYHEFHPSIGAIVDEFFEKNWIHASVKPGKQSGAYSSPTVPSAHPYILMNYNGSSRDVKTLAHELGHGVHQYLSRAQGLFNSGTPLTIAETASVFGEMLVFDSMMRTATTDEQRLGLLMEKLNDITNTVFRQIALNRFEHAAHTARREEGELSTARLNELWVQTQTQSFNGQVTTTDNYRFWWSYISHFIHTPGYVYAYAFGELLVLALYEIYKEDDDSFKDRYIALLSAGGSDSPENLLKPFGIDLTDPAFWQRGLNFIDMLLTQAEELAKRVAR